MRWDFFIEERKKERKEEGRERERKEEKERKGRREGEERDRKKEGRKEGKKGKENLPFWHHNIFIQFHSFFHSQTSKFPSIY